MQRGWWKYNIFMWLLCFRSLPNPSHIPSAGQRVSFSFSRQQQQLRLFFVSLRRLFLLWTSLTLFHLLQHALTAWKCYIPGQSGGNEANPFISLSWFSSSKHAVQRFAFITHIQWDELSKTHKHDEVSQMQSSLFFIFGLRSQGFLLAIKLTNQPFRQVHYITAWMPWPFDVLIEVSCDRLFSCSFTQVFLELVERFGGRGQIFPKQLLKQLDCSEKWMKMVIWRFRQRWRLNRFDNSGFLSQESWHSPDF